VTSTFTPDASALLPGAGWLRARRAAAAARLDATELPTEAEEIWRYSRIGELDVDAFTPVAPDTAAEPGVPAPLERVLQVAGERAGLVVVRNGRIAHVELDDSLARRGVVVGALADADDANDDGATAADVMGAVAASDVDWFTLLNTAFVAEPVVVRVPAGLTVERPIAVLHWIDRDGAGVFPRTIVQTGADADVTVVEYHTSTDVAALTAPVVELDVGDAARMHYLNVQQLGDRIWQVAYQASRVGRDATLDSSSVALGGDYARVRTDSAVVGKGATSNLLAVYFGDGRSMHDFRTMQDHVAPATTSDLLFKGAVRDEAKSVYSGLIRVRKEAAGTNAFQTNRNLVLSEGAHVESVPNLEIEANDVRCSHASAVGPIDEEQRFYLESRGIAPDVAERLIVLGFFAEVLERLPVAALAGPLRTAIMTKLTRA
jgi:Fe-S cluster assembly protein SufD